MKSRLAVMLLLVSLFLVPATATFAQTTCSSEGTLEEFETTFQNDTGIDLTIHWLDTNCVEAEGTPLPAGESFQFITYDGHEFVFRDADGVARLMYMVNTLNADGIIVLSEAIAASDAAQTQEPAPLTCSSEGTGEAFNTTFLNDTETDLTIHWLDFNCVEAEGTPLPIGAEHPLTTYDGHEFIFRDANGESRLMLMVNTLIADEVVPLSRFITVSEPVLESESAQTPAAQSVTGTLSADAEMNSFTFEAQAGVMYAIRLSSSDFDTYLHLYDAANTEIAANDDGGGDLNSLIVFTAPAAGTYTVGIDSFQSGAAGDYLLELSHTTMVILNFLTAANPARTDVLDVQQGITYYVAVNSADFDTTLTIRDENGDDVVSNDDAGDGSTNSFVWFTAGSTGTYTINSSSFNSTGVGQYSVLIGSFAAG